MVGRRGLREGSFRGGVVVNALQSKLEKQLLESVVVQLGVEAECIQDGITKGDVPTVRLEDTERVLVNVVQCLRLVIASRKLDGRKGTDS